MKKSDFSEFGGRTLLAIFLFSTHAKLFYWLKPDWSEAKEIIPFSFLRFTENTVQACIFGLLFGVMTVFILKKRKYSPLFKTFVICIAILDGLVVQYLYNEIITDKARIIFASTHYMIYSIFIVLMFGFTGDKKETLLNQQENKTELQEIGRNETEKESKEIQYRSKNDEKVMDLLHSGLDPKQVADALNMNKSSIYRIKNKYDNE